MIGYDKWQYAEDIDPRFPDPSDLKVILERKVVVNTALTKKPARSEKDKFYSFVPRMNALERSFSR